MIISLRHATVCINLLHVMEQEKTEEQEQMLKDIRLKYEQMTVLKKKRSKMEAEKK